jgi:hypothetical protein
MIEAIIFGLGVVFVFIIGFIAGAIQTSFLYEESKRDEHINS